MKQKFLLPVIMVVTLIMSACGASAEKVNNRGNQAFDGTEVIVLESRGYRNRLAVPHTTVQGWVPAGDVERVAL